MPRALTVVMMTKTKLRKRAGEGLTIIVVKERMVGECHSLVDTNAAFRKCEIHPYRWQGARE